MVSTPQKPGFTDHLLRRALDLGASDIHLDPVSEGISLRMRIDGHFTKREQIESREAERLIGRLKVLADLMVYRSDIPQEGRIELPNGDDARVAMIPSSRGEKATIRIFNSGLRIDTIDDLGLSDANSAWLHQSIQKDHGLVLIVGPSGSGKTSTLYAAMREIASTRGDFCQLASIEDPVEQDIDSCTQIQVDPIRNMDFASGLKYLLRQDPEVIMVGEIRDAETAHIAVRAAMTGHLVLSSLHCGEASEARPRLLEMGVEEYAVNIALAGVMAQRLIRRVCSTCDAAGCPACLDSGYHGRMAVSEIAGQSEKTMLDEARCKVVKRLTTELEVKRVFGGRS